MVDPSAEALRPTMIVVHPDTAERGPSRLHATSRAARMQLLRHMMPVNDLICCVPRVVTAEIGVNEERRTCHLPAAMQYTGFWEETGEQRPVVHNTCCSCCCSLCRWVWLIGRISGYQTRIVPTLPFNLAILTRTSNQARRGSLYRSRASLAFVCITPDLRATEVSISTQQGVRRSSPLRLKIQRGNGRCDTLQFPYIHIRSYSKFTSSQSRRSKQAHNTLTHISLTRYKRDAWIEVG